MSSTNKEIQKAVVLRLSNISLDDIRTIPEVEKLASEGVTLRLKPSLIAEPKNQEYQALTGQYPANFGFFDTLIPACHLPRTEGSASDYTIVEVQNGRDTTPAFLPDLLERAGWNVQRAVCSLAEMDRVLQRLMHDQARLPTCLFLNCAIEGALSSNHLTPTLQSTLSSIQSWIANNGLIALFSDTQSAHVHRFVNMNNFLADMGILERDEQTNSIHWSDSLAYFAGHGQLWLNVLGRDPQGAVQFQDEYDEVRDTLVNALPNKLRDPETGDPVIERVYRKEELYNGNFLFCAPDLVVTFKPGYAASPRSSTRHFDETVFSTPSPDTTVVAGTHPSSLKGFLLAAAPTLARGAAASSQLITITPTLLHALGIAYTGLEGTPVEEAFSYSYLEAHPIQKGHDQDLSEEDEELVINRLRDLGYI